MIHFKIPHLFYTLFPKFYIRHLKQIGVKIGAGTIFYGKIEIDETMPSLVEIGENCVFTDGVKIVTHDFVYSVISNLLCKRIDDVFPSQKVKIGKNVYIGVNAIILKNVTIGDNTVIGAGSVVTRSIPANSVAVGNPCKVISDIETYYQKCIVKTIQQ